LMALDMLLSKRERRAQAPPPSGPPVPSEPMLSPSAGPSEPPAP
jgi:hypothetical protein